MVMMGSFEAEEWSAGTCSCGGSKQIRSRACRSFPTTPRAVASQSWSRRGGASEKPPNDCWPASIQGCGH